MERKEAVICMAKFGKTPASPLLAVNSSLKPTKGGEDRGKNVCAPLILKQAAARAHYNSLVWCAYTHIHTQTWQLLGNEFHCHPASTHMGIGGAAVSMWLSVSCLPPLPRPHLHFAAGRFGTVSAWWIINQDWFAQRERGQKSSLSKYTEANAEHVCIKGTIDCGNAINSQCPWTNLIKNRRE